MRKLPLLIAGIVLAWTGAVAAHGDGPSRRDDMERRTQYGPVVGVDDSRHSGTYAWKGIPFAQPPVGELRWKAPVEPARWKAPRAATQFGNACVQYGRIYGPGATTATTRVSAARWARQWAARTACT